jgi:hypothetical protein
MSEHDATRWEEMTGEEARAVRKSRQAPGKARMLPTYVKIKSNPIQGGETMDPTLYIERKNFNDDDTIDYIRTDTIPNYDHNYFPRNDYDCEDIEDLAKKVYTELVLFGDSDVMCTYIKRKKYQKAGVIKYELIEHWREKRLPIPELETDFNVGCIVFSTKSRGFDLLSETKEESEIPDKPPPCIGTVFTKNIVF